MSHVELDRAVVAALDRLEAGEPMSEIAEDFGVPIYFLEALVWLRDLLYRVTAPTASVQEEDDRQAAFAEARELTCDRGRREVGDE